MSVLGFLIKRSVQIGSQTNRQFMKPERLQRLVFTRLLERAAFTSFGRHYDFRGILMSKKPIETFQNTLPVFDYNAIYDNWWSRTMNNEEDVCWEGKVKYFAVSSGTSGAPSKYIPITEDMLNAMRRGSIKCFFSLSKFNLPASFYSKEMLMIGSSSILQDNGGYYTGDLSGINAKMPPLWVRGYYRPGTEIQKIKDWDDRIKVICQKAPKWDIGSLTGLPSWIQLTLEHIIDYHKLDNINEIWPNLEVFVHSGIAVGPYKKTFEKLCKKPLQYMDAYLASEGFIAFESHPNSKGMSLLLNNKIFFEFIPFNEQNFDENGDLKPNPQALTLEGITEKQDYAIVLNTCAGAWRYLLGDVIRFVDKEKAEIVITGRTKHFLSITGEHVSVDNMNFAIEKAQEIFDIQIPEFTVAALRHGEYFKHKWYVSCDKSIDKQLLIKKLDEALCEANDDYRTERQHFLDVDIEILSNAAFYAWLEKEGRSFGQSKFPRVMKSSQIQEWENFIQPYKI